MSIENYKKQFFQKNADFFVVSFCRRLPTTQLGGANSTKNDAFLVPLLDAFLIKIDSKSGVSFVLANQNASFFASEVYDKSRRLFFKTEFVKDRQIVS